MKKVTAFLLTALLLTGCGIPAMPEATPTQQTGPAAIQSSITEVTLSDSGITVNGGPETDTVFTSHDIIYYEDRDTYASGNPYGEGTDADKHSAAEAAAHTVVNITAPGTYRVSGTLSAGQLRIDLGEDAYEDPAAVVELILQDADIACTVAPAILFLNTYECDGSWSEDNAKPDVDTSSAGANLILEGENTVRGSYVAKIFKDKDEEKKLWKQDGAIYSYMSLNVYGPGSLNLTADSEGLDSELHLTIHGGDITIRAQNDGINTNEDGVSVTTINGGNVNILAGLGAEGDGIDSNGYLVINGGTVFTSAHPASDAGMDSDLGSFVHGGTVLALGSAMDWAESDSKQVTMNLQFAQQQKPDSLIRVTTTDGTEIAAFPASTNGRTFSGAILSSPALSQGETYLVYVDDVQQQYTGTDVGRGGGHGLRPEGMTPPEGFDGQRPPMPEGMEPGEMPEGGFGSQRPQRFDGMDPPALPEGEPHRLPDGDFDNRNPGSRESRTEFYMNDKVNAFSGVSPVTA